VVTSLKEFCVTEFNNSDMHFLYQPTEFGLFITRIMRM